MAAFAPFYRAVQLGPVPLVAGLGATEGGVAAAISFATGERLPALTLLGLLIALGGMVFVLTSVRTPVPAGHGRPAAGGTARDARGIAVRALAVRRRARDRPRARSSGCRRAAAPSARC